MATYGRKKRSPFSTFSVFQDDKQEQAHRSTRGGLANTVRKSSTQNQTGNDDRIESAANALLEDTPSTAGRTLTESSSVSPAGLNRSISTNVSSDILNKPLPCLPSANVPTKSNKLTALRSKSTNLKLHGKNGKTGIKAQISSPIITVPYTSTLSPEEHSSPGDAGVVRIPAEAMGQRKALNPTELSEKISALMKQAETENAKTFPQPHHKSARQKHTATHSPRLLKGKDVLAKAKRAMKNRLTTDRKMQDEGHSTVSSPDELALPHTKLNTKDTRRTLDRRIAEGENLGNRKIQALTGDGNVPRKPLPIYDSHKSPVHSEFDFDPFSDEKEINAMKAADSDFSAFNFDFKSRSRRKSDAGEAILANKNKVQCETGPRSKLKRLSGMLSGLTQHMDTELFSSSPIGFSTPRMRLEPRVDGKGKKLLSSVSVRSPSIMDFSFEEERDERESESLDGKKEVGLHLKRKTARADLRTGSPELSKKPRRDVPFVEESAITNRLAGLATADVDVMERKDVSNGYEASDEAPLSHLSNRRGMNMFDTGKGKAVITASIEDLGPPRIHHSPESHFFHSRPVDESTIRRHVRGPSSISKKHEDDLMSLDELQ